MGISLFLFFGGIKEDSSIDITGSFTISHFDVFGVINNYTHFKFFYWFWYYVPFTELIARY